MPATRLHLVLIRSANIDRAVEFYEAVGLQFVKHAHGAGPEHYCSENAGVVFEIYPLQPGQTPTVDARVGFAVESVDTVVASLLAIGAHVVSQPADSPWGRRAVLADFDGHRVEITTG